MPAAYTGISRHVLDAKNRVFIPQKYRGPGRRYVITSGVDDCMLLYTQKAWESVVRRMEGISLRNKNYQRAFVRTFFADAENVEMDRQGRVLLPQKFKEKYKMKSRLVLVGVRDKVEIWAAETWEKYYRDSTKMLKRIRSQLDI